MRHRIPGSGCCAGSRWVAIEPWRGWCFQVGRRLLAALVGEDLDGVVLSHPVALLLQPPEGPSRCLCETARVPGRVGSAPETPAEALEDASLLLSPLLGAGRDALPGRRRRPSGSCGGFGSRLHRHGRLRVELPVALAAGHQVAVPFLPQPLDAILGRHPPIHHHQRPPGRLEPSSIPASVLAHPPGMAKTFERRTNPAPSSPTPASAADSGAYPSSAPAGPWVDGWPPLQRRCWSDRTG